MEDLDKVFEQAPLPEEPPPDVGDDEPPPDLLDELHGVQGEFDDFMDALEHEGGVWDCTHVDLLGVPITILACVDTTTDFGKAIVAKIDEGGEIRYALMGGQVLVSQLNRVRQYLPLTTTIIKKEGKRYYEFGRGE